MIKMKKILFMMIITITMVSMQIINAEPFTKNNTKTDITGAADEAPAWAEGSFSGSWGIREFSIFFGKLINIELGTIQGYYKTGYLSRISGIFVPNWNQSQKTEISGFYIGPFIFGSLDELNIQDPDYTAATNKTVYVGLGSQNVTSFNWRIMGKEGPTFYIEGVLSKFD